MFVGASSEQAQVAFSSSGWTKESEQPPHLPTGDVVSTTAAPFISPAIKFDAQSGIAVWEILNGQTGEVEVQYPSKAVVEEYGRHGSSAPETAKPEAAPTTSGDATVPPSSPQAAPIPTPPPAAVVASAVHASTVA